MARRAKRLAWLAHALLLPEWEHERRLAALVHAESPRREQLTMNDILVPLDGSESAERVLALAATLSLASRPSMGRAGPRWGGAGTRADH
jgi:hypothetical protein